MIPFSLAGGTFFFSREGISGPYPYQPFGTCDISDVCGVEVGSTTGFVGTTPSTSQRLDPPGGPEYNPKLYLFNILFGRCGDVLTAQMMLVQSSQ